MKIQLTTSLASEKRSWKPGDVIDVTEAEGRRHLANGNGVPYVEPKDDADPRTAKAK